jgi:hypothetical protein
MCGKEKNPPIMHPSGPHSEHKEKPNAQYPTSNSDSKLDVESWMLNVGRL